MVLSEELSVGNSLCQEGEGFWDLRELFLHH